MADKVYGLNEQQVERLRRLLDAFEAGRLRPLPSQSMQPSGSQARRPIPFFNDSGEEIPAYAIMLITGADGDFFTVAQSDADNITPAALLFNGPVAVEDQDYGLGWADVPANVACSDTPSAGDALGTASGSWELHTGKTGYIYLGDTDVEDVVTVRIAPVTPGSITVRGSASSPSYSSVTTIQFDIGNSLTSPSSGVVLVQAASDSVSGFLTHGAQAIGGNKTFHGSVTVNNSSATTFTNNGGTLLNNGAIIKSTGGEFRAAIGGIGVYVFGTAGTSDGSAYERCEIDYNKVLFNSSTGPTGSISAEAVGGNNALVLRQNTGGPYYARLFGQHSDHSNGTVFAIQGTSNAAYGIQATVGDGGELFVGRTGTVSGLVFRGGLCISGTLNPGGFNGTVP